MSTNEITYLRLYVVIYGTADKVSAYSERHKIVIQNPSSSGVTEKTNYSINFLLTVFFKLINIMAQQKHPMKNAVFL